MIISKSPLVPYYGQSREEIIAHAIKLEAALNECAEYFNQRSDADCDQDGFIPNEEMRLLTEIEEALGKGGY